jgi:hypothetical protein
MSPEPYGNEIFPYVTASSADATNPCNVDVQFYVEIDNPNGTPPVSTNVGYSAYDANLTPLSFVSAPNPVIVNSRVGTSKKWRSAIQTAVVNCQNATAQQCYLLLTAGDTEGDASQPMGPNSPLPFTCPCAFGETSEPAPASSGARGVRRLRSRSSFE